MFKKFFLAALVFSVLSAPAYASYSNAGDAYATPTFMELSRTLLMMGGLDVSDPSVVDDYAAMVACGQYHDKYKNDFGWNNIRRTLVTRITNKEDYYRVL